MKNLSTYIAVMTLSAFVFYHAHAQEAAGQDSITKQLDKLLASKDPDDRQLLDDRLKMLAASNTEMDMSIAGSYYFKLKNAKASDSVFAAAIHKFPKGLEARIKAQQAISQIKNLEERVKAYDEFVKNFPPDSYRQLPFGEDRLSYDRLRINIAIGYARERNIAKAGYYASLLEADFWKGRAYSDLSNTFYANGDLVHAGLYQKKAIENAIPYAEGKLGSSVAAQFAAKSYAGACRTYAQILYEQLKYSEALKYIEMAVQAAKAPSAEFNYIYAEILAAVNRNQEAYTKIEAAVKSGEATEEMSKLFKVLYVKTKGTNAGLETYNSAIQKGVIDNLRKRLTKNIISEPAANFSLTELYGNRVNLSDFKGKIVILDFWATWCVPCKASFPGMQMAVEKYKNDPNVKFLFIHTWERTTSPTADAKAYIDDMKYSFQVLMDTKDPETKANKVVDSYRVVSIPAKFVIDEKGNVRFKLTGFKGSKEAAVDEISMMIDIIKVETQMIFH